MFRFGTMIENILDIRVTRTFKCVRCSQSKADHLLDSFGLMEITRSLRAIRIGISGYVYIESRDCFLMIRKYGVYFGNQLDGRFDIKRSFIGIVFSDRHIQELCSCIGIEQKLSCSRISDPISVAVRGIGVIKRFVWSFLLNVQNGTSDWSYILAYAVILNRADCAATEFKVSYGRLIVKRVSYDWFDLFGFRVMFKEDSSDNTASLSEGARTLPRCSLRIQGCYVQSPRSRQVVFNRYVNSSNSIRRIGGPNRNVYGEIKSFENREKGFVERCFRNLFAIRPCC